MRRGCCFWILEGGQMDPLARLCLAVYFADPNIVKASSSNARFQQELPTHPARLQRVGVKLSRPTIVTARTGVSEETHLVSLLHSAVFSLEGMGVPVVLRATLCLVL